LRAERALEIERRVPAPPETVFSYFTDPEKHQLWQGVAAELDARPGGRYLVHFSERGRVRGEYLVVDPPRRLVLTWGWEGDEAIPQQITAITPGSSTVEIEFVPDGDETVLRLRHSGLPPDDSFFAMGWNLYLPRLAAAATGEDAGPDPLSAAFAQGAGPAALPG
jgi:uncharacterized protein YndB with AHSA1/START domain